MESTFHATTILAVRREEHAVLAGDGQVTLGNTVVKQGARKIRRLYNDNILAGFAGSAADSFALFARFESKLEQYRGNLERSAVELAKDWRTDRALRRLEAMLVVLDKQSMFLLSGTGDVIEPDEGIIGIGSGGAFAQAAAKALARHTALGAARDREARDDDRRRDLHLHQRQPHHRRTVMAPISLPERTNTGIDSLTPREIVAELDKYVVGQAKAKRAVAIALRNRMRRQKLPADLAEDVAPKNILMIGPTGVGKTEIARRLAKLAHSPFIKVEASKFTEVGYVGRDVESMVRDLVELAVNMVREERIEDVRAKAELNTEERLLDLLLPPRPTAPDEDPGRVRDEMGGTRQRMREQLRDGKLDDRVVEVDVQEKSFPSIELITGLVDGRSRRQPPRHDAGLFQGRSKRRRVTVAEARERLLPEEEQKLIDMDAVDARRGRARRAGRHHLRRRDRQDRGARRQPRPGSEPRRRAARHPADRRGHHGQHQARHGADRSHPVHRRRRVPRLEAVGPDSGAAGPVSDPRRARTARPGGVRAHPDRAA